MKTFLGKKASRIQEAVDQEDKRRLMRLREAKDNKDIKKVVEIWAEEKLHPKILSDKQRTVIYLSVSECRLLKENFILGVMTQCFSES